MTKTLTFAAISLCSGLLLAAQTASPSAQNTWTGLLVATGCQAATAHGNSATPSTAAANGAVTGTSSNTTGSDLNSTNSATAGAADRAADQNFPRTTASEAENTRATPSSGMPLRTGDMDVADMGTNGRDNSETYSPDRGWMQAKTQAAGLGSACRVGSDTTSYSLMMPDGRLIPFDSASNQKIADRLRSRFPRKSTKIFRVVVKGTMQGDTITLDSLQI